MARILVIDGDEDLLSLYEMLLQTEGHVVSCAQMHTVSRQMVEMLQPELIVLDMIAGSQQLAGWYLLQNLDTFLSTHHVPVLLCTAAYINGGYTVYFQSHNVAMLPKPFDIDMFIHTTSSLLHTSLGQTA